MSFRVVPALLAATAVLGWVLAMSIVPARADEAPGLHDHSTAQQVPPATDANRTTTRKADEAGSEFDWGLPESHDHSATGEHPATDDHAATEDSATSDEHSDQGALPANPDDHAAHSPEEHAAVTEDLTSGGEHGDSHASPAEPASKPPWRWAVVGAFAALNAAVLLAAAVIGRRGGSDRRERRRAARRTAPANA